MALRIAAPKSGSATVILLHGLGDTGKGWSFFPAECYERPSLRHVNFVLPTAGVRNYPAFGGPATGWYGMSGVGKSIEQVVNDFDGLQSTMALIKKLVQEEMDRGVPASRILVGGFSQGAGAAAAFATTYKEHKLAGFVVLSGFLPHVKDLEPIKSSTNVNQPVFIGHGTADGIVPYKEGEIALKNFETKFGFTNVQFHAYPGLPHSVDTEELEHLYDFLERALPPQ